MAGNIRLTKAVMRVFRGAGKEAPALVLKPTFPANGRTIGYFLGDLLAAFLDCLSWKYPVPIYRLSGIIERELLSFLVLVRRARP